MAELTLIHLEPPRVRLVSPLPAAFFANPELQPLRGAR